MKISLYNIVKGLRYWKNYGFKEFAVRAQERLEPDEIPYGPWYEKHEASLEQLQEQKIRSDKWVLRPLVSICVPLYNTPASFLKEMIDSVQRQSYTNWQLCLADGSNAEEAKRVEQIVARYQKSDLRIRYLHLLENKGISGNTNAAFALATGDWIGLLDHDDVLAPDALYEVINKVLEQEEVDVVYTDEDKVAEDLSEHFKPHFKPDFNIDLLRSNNYITHFLVVRKSIVECIGGFRSEFDGAQDYDFIFRCIKKARKVAHIPRILYHWRVSRGSTADNPASKEYALEAGKRVIEAHLKVENVSAEVTRMHAAGFYSVSYHMQEESLVSIIIPNKDEIASLDKCLRSIEKSTYQNYEVIIVENNSEKEETFTYYSQLVGQAYRADDICEGMLVTGQRVGVVTWKSDFNYSAINNFGAGYANGTYYVLLNNDIEIITNHWMEEMLGNCQREEVGIVGARLLYPDNTIQHAGIVLGIGGIASNMFVGMKKERGGYLQKAMIQLDYSAVTAACMMVKRDVFEQVNGFTEALAVAFNDVDFCLKVGKEGYLVVYNPKVIAYHYESKSRGEEATREKVKRFGTEMDYVRRNWGYLLRSDPCYNQNLTLNKSNYSLKKM